jgi:hypothetical protein
MSTQTMQRNSVQYLADVCTSIQPGTTRLDAHSEGKLLATLGVNVPIFLRDYKDHTHRHI